jgi:hypothetical protein
MLKALPGALYVRITVSRRQQSGQTEGGRWCFLTIQVFRL